MPVKSVKKAIEISDAKIDYLSLVDKAANKWQWIVAKELGAPNRFRYDKPILKSESEGDNHFVIGVVYEPMTADYHDNFMTEEEIKKACEWFNENGLGSDLQHNENTLEGVKIVKSWVTEEDTTIEGTVVKAGTWLAKAEIVDDDLWSKIEKGEITGWSMGGTGKYSTQDVDIDEIEKSIGQSILDKIGKALGLTPKHIQKGAYSEKYKETAKRNNFWNAVSTLEDILYPYSSWDYTRSFESDVDKIKEALQEFSETMEGILLGTPEEVAKSFELPVNKAGKKISSKNVEKLKTAQSAINELLDSVEEEEEMNEAQVQKMIDEAIKKALDGTKPVEGEVNKNEGQQATTEDIVAKAVEKAMLEAGLIQKQEEKTEEEKIAEAVAKAMAPYVGSKQIAKNGEEGQEVQKSVFKGLFGGSQE
ncbi:putative serine protease [Clostridium phage CPAS-15]|uniref:XkdF-like putative serine protease domain-containing protein n=1 Tax=Enterococcus faecium TaxID=1352 RepID=UPI0014634A42|nr:XkdF-like putative serine protease domain-containing protein [Enterococcus faecium]QGF20105.1 putative serine protease [Clostridium phage CPAS-15]